MDLLSVLAKVRRQTTLTPSGLTSNARFAARFSIAPNAAPIAVAPGTCGRAGLPVTRMITPERCLIMWRAAARPVIKRDLTIVASGTMNSSTGKSTAFLPFPYSLARGPVTSRMMSILPLLFHNALEVFIDGGVVEGVNYGRLR